jgi:hypothetical protein
VLATAGAGEDFELLSHENPRFYCSRAAKPP